MNGWVVLLWAFVSALVLIVVGIFVSLVLMGRITLFANAEPEVVPTPEVTGVVDASYPVLVLNATSDEGLEVQMRDTLLNSGWAADLVTTGPAGSQDYADTIIFYESQEQELAALGLADVIGGAQIEQSDVYPEQLVVVIGQDRAASQPESTDPPAD